MSNATLDNLVRSGTIKSYEYMNLDQDGNFGSSANRNTERLVLTFNNEEILVIDTFCSGSFQNTHLMFSTE